MLKIRLSRTGKRNQPTFRIVVTEHSAPANCGHIKHIGFYNPRTKEFKIDKDELENWQKKGAALSDTVNNLLVREKILKKSNIRKISRKPKKKEKDKEEKTEKTAKKPAGEEVKKEKTKPSAKKPKNDQPKKKVDEKSARG